ncbi:MAG: putative C-S lyase [Clostridiales bacterium]|nr:putative C-S lyase [Clostridiales bacterium]
MKIDFDKIIDRRNTGSLKWDLCGERFGKKDILPMWVADMDFPSPAEVTAAIIKRAEHGIFGYTAETEGLNSAIEGWLKRRHGWSIDTQWLVHTPGVVTSVKTAVRAFTNEGDKVLIQTPVYYPFYSSISDNGRQIVENPLVENDGNFEIDFSDLERKLSDNVRMMILCSPHNPIGRVWKQHELERIAELCLKYNVVVVSDEIHFDLVFKGNKHIPFATISEEMAGNVITCISPTKTFNIAGLSQSSVIIKNRELRHRFSASLRNSGAEMLNVFGLTAAEAAYSQGEEWLEDLLGYLEKNLDTLMKYFKENIPSIKVVKPEATYLAWLDCRGIMDMAGDLKEFFVEKAGVGMNEGKSFGIAGEGFQRLNFACPEELLLEGLRKIDHAIKNILT